MKKDFYSSDLGKIQMHFHTTIRNIGLYLSVSLGLFGAARYYRKGSEKSRYRQLLFVILSLAFTFNSFIISIAISIPINNIEFFKYGICIFENVLSLEYPSK